MNLSFFAGALVTYVLTNENGKKMLDKATNAIGGAAEKIASLGFETIKEALPETSKLIGGIKHEVESTVSEHTPE